MTSSFLPDINVWIALHLSRHRHHEAAGAWFRSIGEDSPLVFCRHTHIGMFRLLSTESVMQGATLTQKQCWAIYARWIEGGRAFLHADPAGIDVAFKQLTSAEVVSPKMWADAYIAAFAQAAGLTLVTLDKALAAKVKGATLLT